MPSILGFLTTDSEKTDLYREIYMRDLSSSIDFIGSVVEKLKSILKEIYTNLDKFDTSSAARIYRNLHEIEFYVNSQGDKLSEEIPSMDDDYVGEFPCVDALLCKSSSLMRTVISMAKLCYVHREKAPSVIVDVTLRFKRINESLDRLQKYITDSIIRNQIG